MALGFLLTSLLSLATAGGCASPAAPDPSRSGTAALVVSPGLVISQVYGGGGNNSAVYTHDYVELFNRGTVAVSLSGKSLQYAATNSSFIGANAVALPAVSIQPGQHFSIQLATGGAVGAPLPAPDFVTTGSDMLALANSTGKVALVDSAAVLNGCGTNPNPCTLGAWIDLIGYGAASQAEGATAPALSNLTAAIRSGAGCVDTGDNALDFDAGQPTPRNAGAAIVDCFFDAAADASAGLDAGQAADASDAAAPSDASDASDTASAADGADASSEPDAGDASLDAGLDAAPDASIDASADASDASTTSDAGPASLVLLNEIKMNPPTTTDAPWEYVELLCTPDASLDDWYFVAFEGDGDSVGPPGTADFVVDLRGTVCGSNGIAYIKAARGGATAQSAQSAVILSGFLSLGTSPLENATTSFVLVHSASAPMVQTADYDANDDGVLELPAGASVVDGIATFDEGVNATDVTYAPRLLQTTGAPDAVTRFPANTTPLSAGAWYGGDLSGTSASSLVYDNTNASANYPIDGALTPGAPNVGTAGTSGNVDGGTTATDAGSNLDAGSGDSGVKKDGGPIANADAGVDASIVDPPSDGGKPISDASRDAADAAASDSGYPPSVTGCACQLPNAALAGSGPNALGAMILVVAAMLRRRSAPQRAP